jgi:hypothetical protein
MRDHEFYRLSLVGKSFALARDAMTLAREARQEGSKGARKVYVRQARQWLESSIRSLKLADLPKR